MSEVDELRLTRALHDYAMRHTLEAIAALLDATHFDATPAVRHKARYEAANAVAVAHMALEQAKLIGAYGDDCDERA